MGGRSEAGATVSGFDRAPDGDEAKQLVLCRGVTGANKARAFQSSSLEVPSNSLSISDVVLAARAGLCVSD